MNIQDSEKIAMRVSRVSIIGNLALSLVKLLAGVVAHSAAMISDAVHSASDVFSTLIVIVGFKMSAKKADKEHPYGHERMECVASIVLAVVLLLTGVEIGRSAAVKLFVGGEEAAVMPGALALAAAILSIVVKELMYQYTMVYAKRIESGALKADAWHHRSDALSSVGALIGIAGARMGYPFMEPLACIVICLFIVKAAVEIFRDAVDKMVDRSCDEETQLRMKSVIQEEKGVENVVSLNTRMFASKVYVDTVISVDRSLSVVEAHDIAESVHDDIEKNFPEVKHCMVHVDPAEE